MYGFLMICFLSIATILPSADIDILPVPDTVSGGNITVSGGDVYTPDMSVLQSIDDKLDIVVTALSPAVDSVQVTDYYKDYFRGVLKNMPDTDYLCYAQRISNGYNTYITHYYMMYDLNVVDGSVTPANYPCIDIYSVNGVQYCDDIIKYFSGYPTVGFASFAPYSALIDKSFNFMYLNMIMLCIIFLYIICRKTVFS